MIGATSLILTLLFSTEPFGLCALKSFKGISSLTNSIIPPPEVFLSSRDREVKPLISDWLEEEDESTFIPSNLYRAISCSISNLFLKDFKLI